MKNIIKSLALMLALIVAMSLSFAVLAEDGQDDSSVESSEVSADASADASDAASETSSEDASSEASVEASSEAASSEAVTESSTIVPELPESEGTGEEISNFPWARVITLIVVVVLIAVIWILTKTNTAIGQRLKKFFKEYWSEIKKVSWSSPKDTAKATGIVLVFLIVAAVAIGLLDLGFTYTVKKIAEIFN